MLCVVRMLYGVEWFGVELSGVVWSGVVWCDCYG